MTFFAPAMIDYDKLSQLCSHQGLRQRLDNATTEEAHSYFMDHYRDMFVHECGDTSVAISAITETSHNEEDGKEKITVSDSDASTRKTIVGEYINHDIRYHMAKLHKERQIADPDVIFNNRIREMKSLIKKMPYERTAGDTKQLFGHLKTFEDLSKQVSSKELRDLCTAVQQDIWRDEGYTVFANTGFHIILRGSVTPVTCPWIKVRGQPLIPAATTTSSLSNVELSVGDCFGTLERVEGPEPNSRILCVQIKSVPCEFLKIHSNDFKRITDRIRENETAEKISLIQSCRAYQLWPRQSLLKLAELVEWTKFPQNTVLVSEGFYCPFIVFIRKGECHVLKEIKVNTTSPGGDKKWKKKQVVVGQMSTSESFGEVGILKEKPITSSVVTATQVDIGIIARERLQELDETTRVLLLQSNEKYYKTMTEDQIRDEYINQEQKRRWNRYKGDVMVKTMNASGITPGHGRWTSK